MADSLILMVLALVVFGPRRLPQIGRQIGKLMYEFRKASNDFKFQMEEELRHCRRGRPPQEGRRAASAPCAAPAADRASIGLSRSSGTGPKPIAVTLSRSRAPIPSQYPHRNHPAAAQPKRLSLASCRLPRARPVAAAAAWPRLGDSSRRDAPAEPPHATADSPDTNCPDESADQREPLHPTSGGAKPPWLIPRKQSARRERRSPSARNSPA